MRAFQQCRCTSNHLSGNMTSDWWGACPLPIPGELLHIHAQSQAITMLIQSLPHLSQPLSALVFRRAQSCNPLLQLFFFICYLPIIIAQSKRPRLFWSHFVWQKLLCLLRFAPKRLVFSRELCFASAQITTGLGVLEDSV